MSGNNFAQIVGTAIGYYFFGPLGGAVGGLIGGALVPAELPDKVGPRITDLRPQSSEYGRPIPIVFGSVALGGNVIWAAPLFELSQATEAGGKGGGPTQTSINFSYYSYFAVLICEGEKDIGRIWAGPEKRLVYDGNGFVEGGDFGFGAVRVYRGTEDQMPDPLLEFYLGVGNVPAYRGSCYVVFQNFPVVNDGNRIPFLWVEVGSANGVIERDPVYLGASGTADNYFSDIVAMVDPVTGYIWSATRAFLQNTLEVRVNSDVTKTQIASFSVPIPTSFTLGDIVYVPGDLTNPGRMIFNGNRWLAIDYAISFNADSLTLEGGTSYGSVGTSAIHRSLYNPVTETVMVFRYGGYYDTDYTAGNHTLNLGESLFVGDHTGICWFADACLAGDNFAVFKYGGVNGVIVRSLTPEGIDGNHPAVGFYPTTSVPLHSGTMFYDSVRNRIIVCHNVTMAFDVIDLDTEVVTYHTLTAAVGGDTTPPPGLILQTAVMYGGDYVFGVTPGADATRGSALFIVDPDTLVTTNTYTYEAGGVSGVNILMAPLLVPKGGSTPYLFSFDSNNVKRLYLLPTGMGGQSLASVVTDLSLRTGLTEDDIDVEQLTDTVDGYAITQQTTVRQAIDPLRTAYYFDSVESGEVIKFVKRGGELVREISDDDLAAHVDGEQSPEPLSTTRQMEDELPKYVSVTHLLAASKYSPATKEAERQIGSSDQRVTIDLPIVLTDTKAQEVAQVNLHAAWAQRLTYSLDLGRKHSDLEPTDVIMAKGHTMRIVKVVDTPNGVRKINAIRDNTHYYVPHVIVTETPPPVEEVFVPDETILELM